jgi:hypothetical protein
MTHSAGLGCGDLLAHTATFVSLLVLGPANYSLVKKNTDAVA